MYRIPAALMLGVLVLVGCGSDTSDIDASRAETDAIIQAWIDGWLADDPDAVIVLYAEDGIYADAAYPFEYPVDFLVPQHMSRTKYTAADPLKVSYTDTGAVVDWLWEGVDWYRSGAEGDEFSMHASTTFEIQDGKIERSTDSYLRCVAPWTEDCES